MDFAIEIDIALLVLRLGAGIGLMAHGYGKIFGEGGLTATGNWFESIGVRPGRLHAVMASSNEILIGLAFAAGLVTSVAALGYVTLMFVAYWTVHRANGFFILKQGWEYVFTLALLSYAIATIGPGAFSIDAVIGIDQYLDGWIGSILALAGIVAGVGFLVLFYRPSKIESSTEA